MMPAMLDNFPPAALYPAYLTPEATGAASGSSPGEKSNHGMPTTPKSYADLSHIIFEPNLKTSNLAPHAYSQLLHNLYKNGPICGSTFGSVCDEDDPSREMTYYSNRLPSAGERRIPEWVRGAEAALAHEPLPASPPPLEPPLSPTLGAPCAPQSERIRKSVEETSALKDDDAVSVTDKTCLEEHFYHDDDVVSETEPLGPPVTEHHDYYVNRHDVEPDTAGGNVVQALEEITATCGQPQDLLENLQLNIHRLRKLARHRPRMLEQIDMLDAQAIVVVEMTSKLSRRVGFFERVVEEQLPELDDDKANADLFANLNYRLMALEDCLGVEALESDRELIGTSPPPSSFPAAAAAYPQEQDADMSDAIDVDPQPVRANL
jgi:hypothetical protein